ncbi:MAG: cytochrome c [Anaerolineales bacterium]
MKWYIGLGTAATVLVTIALVILGVGEQARMRDFTSAFEARQIENGAALFENNCRTCHGPQGRGIEGVAPALNAADLFNGDRLDGIGYTGTTEDYIRSTISAGRPVPSEGTSYPQRMPTWSQEYGGPLRGDQIDSLVAFVMNWEEIALARGEPTPAVPAGEGVGSDITVSLPEGDPEQGQALAEGGLGCVGCHILSSTGPAWEGGNGVDGVGVRAETRFQQDNYTGAAESAQQYLVESIVRPGAFVVEGFANGLMPQNYGDRLTAQDLADLVAYLETFQ